MKRYDDESAWCDVGQYRACIERRSGALRFSVHGKPDSSRGFRQPVVLSRGWIREGDAVEYSSGSAPLPEALERELVAASRRAAMRAVD